MYACKICTCVWGRKESPTEHKTGESLSFFFSGGGGGLGFWLGGGILTHRGANRIYYIDR